MARSIKFLAFALLIFTAASCTKESNPITVSTTVNFTATLDGASESTPNASTATGSSAGVYNTSTKVLTVTTTYTGLTVTMAHIHKGDVGVSGPVVFPFIVTASPIVFTSAALSASQETDLMADKYYVNLHSAAFGGGEIRGQLNKQ